MFPLGLLAAAAAILWGLHVLALNIGVPSGSTLPYWLWATAVVTTMVLAVAVLGRVLRIVLSDGAADGGSPPIARVLIYGVLTAGGALLLVVIFGGNPLTLLTTSAVFSVFAGIALQPVMTALFSGAVLQFERRVVPGAWIEVDGRVLKVETTSWRAITGRTATLETVIVPNAKLLGSVLVKKQDNDPVRVDISFRVPITLPPQTVSEVLSRAIALMPHVVTAVPIVVAPVEYRLATATVLYRAVFSIYNFEQRRLVEAAVMERLWYVLQRHELPVDFSAGRENAIALPSAARFTRAEVERLRPEILGSDPDLAELAGLMQAPDSFADLLNGRARVLLYAPGEHIVAPPDCAHHLLVLMAGTLSGDRQRLIGHDVFGPRAGPLLDPLPGDALSPFAQLATIAQRLAEDIGPAAEGEIRSLASRHMSIPDLCMAAAQRIPDGDKRTRFLADMTTPPAEFRASPGLLFTVADDLTGLHRPVVPVKADGYVTLAALPRSSLMAHRFSPDTSTAGWERRSTPAHLEQGGTTR